MSKFVLSSKLSIYLYKQLVNKAKLLKCTTIGSYADVFTWALKSRACGTAFEKPVDHVEG